VLDRGRVRVEAHVWLAQWAAGDRLRLAAVNDRQLRLLVERKSDRA
jgi:hypothetical protein